MSDAEFVTWDSSMSVGDDLLDGDHRRLLDMFNGLLKTNVATKAKDDVSALLANLVEYVDVHFSREEEALERCRYPGLTAHKAAHRYFTDEVHKLHAEFGSSNAMMLRIDLILLLKEWLIEHIQSTDMQYKPFVSADAAGATA